MKKQRNPRPGSFETLSEAAWKEVEIALGFIKTRRCPQKVAYRMLRDRLEGNGIAASQIPSFSSFNRLVLRKSGRVETDAKSPAPFAISGNTRRLLATGLRALADDLDGGAAGTLTPEAAAQFRRDFLGLSEKAKSYFGRFTAPQVGLYDQNGDLIRDLPSDSTVIYAGLGNAEDQS